MTWLVIGGGVSGLGAAKLLRKRGLTVRVSERSTLPPAKAAAFRDLGVELRDGGHALDHLDQVASVVLSPGLPESHLLIKGAREKGLPVQSEIDLALSAYTGTVIAVTGTNGKSTTCAMLGHILQARGLKAEVGGNFGDPPTAMLAEGRVPDWLVLELSSYQLEQSSRVAAAAAVFTSFSHDHLARHGSMAGYLAAKWKVFANQPKGAVAVLPDYIFAQGKAAGLAIDAHTVRVFKTRAELASACGDGFAVDANAGAVVTARGETVPLGALGIAEPHNLLNAGFALSTLSHLLRASMATLAPSLEGFRALPHRCEVVGTKDGRPLINDSKSTNVESTLVALAGQARPVILMMGGKGKDEPYAPVLTERSKIAALVTFGATGPDIARELKGQLAVHEFPTLKAALDGIGGIMKRYPHGVLFSPGCASFDEFQNYEERGDYFRSRIPRD